MAKGASTSTRDYVFSKPWKKKDELKKVSTFTWGGGGCSKTRRHHRLQSKGGNSPTPPFPISTFQDGANGDVKRKSFPEISYHEKDAK